MKSREVYLVRKKIKECSEKTGIEEKYFEDIVKDNIDIFSGTLSDDTETEQMLDILEDEADRYIEFTELCHGKSTCIPAEERLDAIYDKVYELCSMITDDKDLEADMEYLGEIADFMADTMVKYTGKSVYFPWYDDEGKVHDYYFG